MSKSTKSPRKVKGVGSYLSNVVSNVSDSVKNTGRSVFAPNSKKTQNSRSQYAKNRASKPSKKVAKRKLRSLQAKKLGSKVRKTRKDKGVKRGPRKTM
jgi:hypothetical protein